MSDVVVKKVMKLNKSGAITIPAELRKLLGLFQGDTFEITVNADNGDITLKRIGGVCILTGKKDGLINFQGKLISIDTLVNLSNIYEEGIKDSLEEENGSEMSDMQVSREFKRVFNLQDGFRHIAPFRNNKILIDLENANEDAEKKKLAEEKSKKEMKLLRQKLKKEKEAKLLKDQMTFEDFMALPIERRLSKEELKDLKKEETKEKKKKSDKK